MAVVWILVGLVGVVVGSELALHGAESIARRLGVSPLMVGLTIASIGTSMPEIATNVAAGLSSRAGEDASGLLVGNIVGSCLSQITLLLGLTGLAAPLRRPHGFRRDAGMMLLAAALMYVACSDGTVTPGEGGLLIATYAAYLAYLIVDAYRSDPTVPPHKDETRGGLPADLARVAVGLTAVVAAADVVVGQSVLLAREAGISDGLIGLGLGLGTGMPELAVALQSVRRKTADIGLGNLIGSNITDPLLSFGAGAVISTVNVPPESLWFDFPAWGIASLVAVFFIWTHKQLVRWESGLLLLGFLTFFAVRTVVIGT